MTKIFLILFCPFSCFNPFNEFIIAKIAINKLCINLLSLEITGRKPPKTRPPLLSSPSEARGDSRKRLLL